MAEMTGQLLGDFSDFTRAVDTATVTLKSFETGAEKVEGSLNRMVDNFTGRKLIQDATLMAEAVERIGGVSKLTEAELARVSAKATEAADKLRAMGKDVPAGIQQIADASKQAETATGGWADALGKVNNVLGLLGISATAAGFVSLGKALFEDADTLERLSDRTAIGVETLQRFRVAGNDAGVSLDAMANGMNKLQKNLSEGTTATTDALGALHLNLDDIRKLSPEDQFYAIAKAISEVKDPAEQVELAIKLFGKAGAELLPVIKRGFDDVKDSAVGMSRATVEALDRGGDAWTKYAGIVKAQAGEMLASALTGTSSQYRQAISEAENLADVFKRVGEMAEAAAPKLKTYGLELPSMAAAERDLTKAENDRAAAEKAFAGAMEELNSAGRGWQGTLATIDGAVVEAIKYYLEAGVSQKALAVAYDLTDAQVKAVATSTKEYADVLKAVEKIEGDFVTKQEAGALGLSKTKQDEVQRWVDAEKAGITAINKLRADEHDFILRTTLSSTDYQIAKINEAAQAEIKAFQGTSAQVEEHTTRVLAAAKRQADGIIAAASTALDVIAKKGMDAMAILDLAARQAQAGLAVDVVGNAATAGVPRSGMQAPIYVAPPIFARAAGGPVSSGQSYLVGERGPELFVPSASGGIVPNGGGLVQNIVIHVNGTAADVARQVSDEIMRAAMRGQQFGAS
jgi:hypothetical protein